MKGIYDNLIKDLNLKAEEVPLLAGETVNADQRGTCAGFNRIMAELPKTLPNSHVISSAGCTSNDRLPFHSAGSREFERRYGEKMHSLMGLAVAEYTNGLYVRVGSSAAKTAADGLFAIAEGQQGYFTSRIPIWVVGGKGMFSARAADIVVSIDRKTRQWADLALGPPSGMDDAPQSRNANACSGTCHPPGNPTPTLARAVSICRD